MKPQIKFSDIKALKSDCEALLSSPDWKEVLQNAIDGEEDFTVDNVRFIASSEIDRIQAEELEADPYMLGCFNAWFLADIMGTDQGAIESIQKTEAFEGLGKMIIAAGKVEELQQAYASADGYGHHFNSYDGGEDEWEIAGTSYYVFDNH